MVFLYCVDNDMKCLELFLQLMFKTTFYTLHIEATRFLFRPHMAPHYSNHGLRFENSFLDVPLNYLSNV